MKRGDTVKGSRNSMSIEIEPRSRAATRRVGLVLALLGLAACRTTDLDAGPIALGMLAAPVLVPIGMAADSFRHFTQRHRHGGHVSLDDAYQAAFGLSVRSPDVDPETGRVIHPNPAVPFGVLDGRKTRAVGSMNRAFSHLVSMYGLNRVNYALCQEVLHRDDRTYLLVSVVQLKPGHVSAWLPINVRPNDPMEWFVPNENTDTVIDWVAIDRSLVDDDKIDAYLLAAAVQSILDGRHAPDYWSVSKQWNDGELAAVMALSEQRALRMLNATSAHPFAN
jgi:hypothetical protein